MSQTPLYPLRFEPIYQYRLWGGRRLADLLTAPLPGDGPIGEAWVLSDRDDHPSRVADGSLQGLSIAQLLDQFPEQVMGKLAGRFRRFPLLLKFLDVREMLSVQVHPTDPGTAKTEAWVVLEAGTKSRIYAGLKPGTTEADLRRALTNGSVADYLACFHPKPGDAVFLPAGTVHSLGGGVVVFEVQQNSDVTFRLFDWNHVDPKTRPAATTPGGSGSGLHQFWTVRGRSGNARGGGRHLQFAARDFSTATTSGLSRVRGESPFTVGAAGCAARAGMHRGLGATQSWRRDI